MPSDCNSSQVGQNISFVGHQLALAAPAALLLARLAEHSISHARLFRYYLTTLTHPSLRWRRSDFDIMGKKNARPATLDAYAMYAARNDAHAILRRHNIAITFALGLPVKATNCLDCDVREHFLQLASYISSEP